MTVRVRLTATTEPRDGSKNDIARNAGYKPLIRDGVKSGVTRDSPPDFLRTKKADRRDSISVVRSSPTGTLVAPFPDGTYAVVR